MSRLAAIREPLDYDKGLDVVDLRSGEVLAWRGGDAGASAIEIADKLNETYPDRDSAPDSWVLIETIKGWRITGVAG